jgi:N-acetylglutamate synthase-like GNAT family acetyltransferase
MGGYYHSDKVVSTALFRIFGRHLAEVPIVATSLAHQGQGHCKALMLTIERLLGVMSVERLILPAAKGKESLWIDKFGFTQMNDLQLKKLQAETQIMVFSGLSMLEKAITPMAIC